MGFKQTSPHGGGRWVHSIYIHMYTIGITHRHREREIYIYVFRTRREFNFELCKIKLTLSRAPLGCHISWVSCLVGIWDQLETKIAFARQAKLLEEAEASKEQRQKLLADIEDIGTLPLQN